MKIVAIRFIERPKNKHAENKITKHQHKNRQERKINWSNEKSARQTQGIISQNFQSIFMSW